MKRVLLILGLFSILSFIGKADAVAQATPTAGILPASITMNQSQTKTLNIRIVDGSGGAYYVAYVYNGAGTPSTLCSINPNSSDYSTTCAFGANGINPVGPVGTYTVKVYQNLFSSALDSIVGGSNISTITMNVSTSTPTPTPVFSCTSCDPNGAGCFNLANAQSLQGCFNQSPTGACANWDVNFDGAIDILDFSKCTSSCKCSTPIPTPTPILQAPSNSMAASSAQATLGADGYYQVNIVPSANPAAILDAVGMVAKYIGAPSGAAVTKANFGTTCTTGTWPASSAVCKATVGTETVKFNLGGDRKVCAIFHNNPTAADGWSDPSCTGTITMAPVTLNNTVTADTNITNASLQVGFTPATNVMPNADSVGNVVKYIGAASGQAVTKDNFSGTCASSWPATSPVCKTTIAHETFQFNAGGTGGKEICAIFHNDLLASDGWSNPVCTTPAIQFPCGTVYQGNCCINQKCQTNLGLYCGDTVVPLCYRISDVNSTAAQWTSNFGTSNILFDFNNDNVVNGVDYALWLKAGKSL